MSENNTSGPRNGQVVSIMGMIGAKRDGRGWEDAEIVPDAYPLGTRVKYCSPRHGTKYGTVVEASGHYGQAVIFDDFSTGNVSITRRELREGPREWGRAEDAPDVCAEDIERLKNGLAHYRQRQAREREEGERRKTAQTAETAAELRAKYKWAKPRTEGLSEYARAAANIKQELRREFPGVKFSVRSESFSMGNAVRVGWTLGPTAKQVDEIVNKYQDGHFDGMEDIYNHDSSAYGAAVSEVLGRAKYVSTSRHIPEELHEKAGRALCELQNVTYDGQYTRHLLGQGDDRPLTDHVGALLYGTAFPVGVGTFAGVEYAPDGEREPRQWARLTFETPKTDAPKVEQSAPALPADGEAFTLTRSGEWTWIKFAEKPERAVIDRLKAAGGRWSSTRAAWYFRRPVEAAELGLTSAPEPVPASYFAFCEVCARGFEGADAEEASDMVVAHKQIAHRPEPPDEHDPVWQLFECARGCRWSQVEEYSKDGDVCGFSGCRPNHTIRFVRTTRDRSEAHDWFVSIPPDDTPDPADYGEREARITQAQPRAELRAVPVKPCREIYPELYALAREIGRRVGDEINARAWRVETKEPCPHKAQGTLELLIDLLQEAV